MQQIITVKLKLITTPEQHHLLRQTRLTYRDALNYLSRYAFEQGKTSNNDRLQKGACHEMRLLYGLPSQMACNVPRQVAGTYKGLWTRFMQNREQRRAGRTKKRYKGLDKPPKYFSPAVTYNYGYDYGFKGELRVSALTLSGRIILPYQGYFEHVALIQHGATIGAAKLYYDKPHKQFYLLVSLELDIREPTPETLPEVIGVDVGMRYLATTATLTNESSFYPGKCAGGPNTLHAPIRSACNIACERFSSGRTRRERASCQYAPMRRALRSRRHASRALPSCGRVRMRAPPLSKGRGQPTWTALESMTSPLNGEACKSQSLAGRLTRLSS